MKKILSIIFFLTTIVVGMTSCGAFKSYLATYDVGLKSVESPMDAKKQFGETKVVRFQDGDITKYRYEDDYINIVWLVSEKQFNFELVNKSDHTIKINWDDISFVDYNGNAKRMMHGGVKYIDRNNSQPASTVPKGATLKDMLLPTDNAHYYGGNWTESYLIPRYYSSEALKNAEAPSYVGKTMVIMMPIVIENIQNDYTFTFSIDKLIEL